MSAPAATLGGDRTGASSAAALSARVSLAASRGRLFALLLSVGLFAGLVGGGNGLPAGAVVKALEASLPLRLLAACLYFLLALPAARAALLAADAVYLRSLPVSRAGLLLGQAGVLCLAEAPVVLLCLAGPGGPSVSAARGLCALGALLAGHALALDAPVAGLSLVAAAALHPALAAAAALGAAPLLSRAFALAPAVPRAEHRTPGALSLAGALLRVLLRTRLEALVRAVALLALAVALEWLAGRQQPLRLPAVAATGALFWCALGLGPLLAALEELQTRERWSLLFAPVSVFERAQLSLVLPAALAGGLLAAAPLGITLALRGALAGLCAGAVLYYSERDLERRSAEPAARLARLVASLVVGTLLCWSFP